jgi:hypothetical protein
MRTAFAFFLLVTSCASSPAVSAARRGDSTALAAAVAPALRAGSLQNDDAAQIARAVAEHTIETSKGDDAQARVRELRMCARDLESALSSRAETHDAAGAEAALGLLDVGAWSDATAREWLKDPSDDWRAVGVRGLVRKEDMGARARAMLDPSVKVRRAAMRATMTVDDVGPLLEAARVDPDLMARSEAVRAIARIDPSSRDTALRLHDLWTTSDDALREDIARAYVSPNIAGAGGAEELRGLLAAGHGLGVVGVAASVVMGSRTAPSGAPVFDEETRKSAVALLVRTIDQAPRRERLLALAMAPLSNADVRSAVKRATAETNDLDTREAALARLLDVPAERETAKKALFAFASPSSPETISRRARLALAAEGEIAVQAWIEADLNNADATVKLMAASALVTLHRGARAALLLADPNAHVRTSAACTLLGSSARR